MNRKKQAAPPADGRNQKGQPAPPPWWKRPTTTDWLMGVFTVVLAITAVLQYLVLRQTIAMSRNDQRAWVGAIDPVVVQLKDASLRVSVTIKNLGRTPALNVVPQIHVRTLPASDSFAPSLPTKPTDPDTRAALQPGQQLTLGPGEVPPIPVNLANEINAGNTRFYAFGEVFYDDAFGESHTTTFAFMLLPTLSTWRVLNRYNTAD
ncbi:MAG TPA: hypothetical protein VM221_14285 [Armatimonadota bacterium]|nr:hypothetical protein [Armatimonadota bacterium]